MRIQWGLAIAVVATFAWVNLAQASGPKIDSVQINGAHDGAQVSIKGAFDDPQYAVRAREDGRVIIITVDDAVLPSGGVETSGTSSLVARSVASNTARGVRIELTLTNKATYHARATENGITVKLRSRDASARAKPTKSATSTVPKIEDVRLEHKDGRDRVVISVAGRAEFRVSTRAGAPPRLEVLGARIGSNAKRRIQAPRGSVIGSIELEQRGDRAVVEVHGSEGAAGTAIRSGDQIVWMFSPTSTETRPHTRTIARERDYAAEIDGPEVAGFLSKMPMQVGGNATRRYSGRRIDLDFKDADIHNILRLLSEVGGVNVVTADNVGGTVTIRMRDVPWDQALDVVLQAKSLGMVRQGNLLRVAPLAQLEQEREAAIARQKQQQQLAPLETRLVPVSYATAQNLQPRVRELLTDRGSVSVDNRTNMLIVRDIVGQLDDVEDLVRNLDTQTPQVLIESRIVEASSSYSRDIGIQWGGAAVMSSATGNPTGLRFPSDLGIAGGVPVDAAPTQGLSPFNGSVNNPNFAVNLPAVTGNGAGGALGLTMGSLSGAVNLNVRLSAAEAAGSVRIISSPRVLTLDNSEASISQGTLIPFSQVSAQGVNTAFQEAKLELNVTPHVTNDGAVAMDVKITRNEPDFGRVGANGDPTILEREAITQLLVDDGDTAVIGGIYTRNTGRNVDQVPFLGDIPVLGVLFKRRRFREDRNELLIFLTPRIVNRALALPE
ncbi:MAG: type IV pilus secretin PilQ [Deltaproteobacteria bacterium]|nr:type IV pilus secretin PilQ [Deltaproteobacteria bacterium]MBW2209658.1 type IV pilus secretin PilQ [Deltaproteobacteria bacterium]MBW2213330.1 type IV pilus secretin PilQ [Deltaproteobacteria bacterium]MBW2378815.1 type IV pilus secretin PilQ [Deltaproteobacteria bacterium]MBW2550112.1 type IV pilus secretin PilQ [Deltaproteobacteria bacterium]